MTGTRLSLLIQASLYIVCFVTGYLCGKSESKPKKGKKQLLKD